MSPQRYGCYNIGTRKNGNNNLLEEMMHNALTYRILEQTALIKSGNILHQEACNLK